MFEESFDEAWRLRFGSEPPLEGDIADRISGFLTHRSVREYSEKPIPRDVVAGLVAAAQSAATSSNLQLWSVISVGLGEKRNALAELSGDQRHVEKAPWFFAFCVDTFRLTKAAEAVGEDPAALDTAEFYTMAVIDAALAAERMLAAAESIGISGCYIGALRNDAYRVRELLKLPERTFCVFGLCLGYPAESSTAEIKPRLSQDSVWFEEEYDVERGVGDYDKRMSEFYGSQGMNAGVNWSQRSGRRINGSQMTGREVIKQFLADQGLDLR